MEKTENSTFKKIEFWNFGKNFVPFFKHAFNIDFTPYVFVITGIVASTAFHWLLGFCGQQLKKMVCLKKGTRHNLFPNLSFEGLPGLQSNK